jgi:hypothetical protein
MGEPFFLSPRGRDLAGELADMTRQRDAWKREAEMYAAAWQRELGGRLVPKTHLIDALVLTTRRMREERDRLVREDAERRRAGDVAEYGPFVEREPRP